MYLKLISSKTYINKQIIKYTAAYFERKAKPRKTPSKIKFLIFGKLIIFTNSFNERVQKSNKKISVLIIKVEKETAGINKNINEQERASFLLKPIFLDNIYKDQAVMKYTNDGSNFKEKKESPNIFVCALIAHAKKGGFEKYPKSKS